MIWRMGSMVTLGVTAAFLGTWSAERDPPTYVERFEVQTPKTMAGADFRIKYWVQRKKSCAVKIERLIFDKDRARFILPSIEFSGVPIGQDQYTTVVKIPEEAVNGTAQYRTVTTYRCNPLHQIWPIVVIAEPIQFEIL